MDINYLLYNGCIHTLSPDNPLVTAIAISGDQVVALGNDDLLNQFSRVDEAIDLNKRVVIPGLTDGHVHLELYVNYLNNVDLFGTKDAEEAVSRVSDFNKTHPGEGWITGWGWAQEDWPGRTFPTAALLDKGVKNRPVFLTGKSGHVAWANNLALQIAKITENTDDPLGGKIHHDESGKPSGVLFDEAIKLIENNVPKLSVNELAFRIKEALPILYKQGITGLHDNDGSNCFQALQILQKTNALSLRVTKNIPVNYLDSAIELGLRWGFGNDFLRIGGVKIFADGALGSRTAAMFEPYEGEPDNFGIIITGKEQMVDIVKKASLSGLPSLIHAIGDRAIHDVLDVYVTLRGIERENGILPDTRRHRIEHVQLIHPQDVSRLAELRLIASMQPIHATSDMLVADQCWGDRADLSYNWRVQLNHGAELVFGSDAPVEAINPFWGIHAAVTRRRLGAPSSQVGWRVGKNNCLSVEEAVRAFTLGPAFASGQEDKLGRLAPGYFADLLVLDKDIYNIDPSEIAETKPLFVMIGGKFVIKQD